MATKREAQYAREVLAKAAALFLKHHENDYFTGADVAKVLLSYKIVEVPRGWDV